MKFYSEGLKKFFDTADDCIAAEEKIKAEKAAAKERAEKLKAEKESRQKEVNDALAAAEKLLEKYISDYGSIPFSASKLFHYFF